jgi:hypothetical protein
MADHVNSAGHGTVMLRGWCFCENHGLEYCHSCAMDFRIGNNVGAMPEGWHCSWPIPTGHY